MRRRKHKRKSQRQRIAELEMRCKRLEGLFLKHHRMFIAFDKGLDATEKKVDSLARKSSTPRAAFNLRFWKRKPVSLSVIDDEVS